MTTSAGGRAPINLKQILYSSISEVVGHSAGVSRVPATTQLFADWQSAVAHLGRYLCLSRTDGDPSTCGNAERC